MVKSLVIQIPQNIQIDKLGRVVVPQDVRRRLNIQPGTKLKVFLEDENKIVLQIVEEEPVTERKDGVLLIAGELTEPDLDLVELVKQDRERKLL